MAHLKKREIGTVLTGTQREGKTKRNRESTKLK